MQTHRALAYCTKFERGNKNDSLKITEKCSKKLELMPLECYNLLYKMYHFNHFSIYDVL